MNEEMRLLHHIGVVDFVLVEFMLYLDTHPKDKEALEYFNHYSRVKQQLMKEFAAKYYPLSKDYAESCKEWTWVMAPNPWEGVC